MTDWNKKKIDRYEAAIAEARRFLEKAKAAKVEIATDIGCGNVRQAAAKRASMDLTRALAQLRRSIYT